MRLRVSDFLIAVILCFMSIALMLQRITNLMKIEKSILETLFF